MKAVRLQLTDEQIKKLASIEKGMNKLHKQPFAVFAQIRYPDGKMSVILISGEDAVSIHNLLREGTK